MSERTLEQLMADRYSCRNYSDRKLEEGILNQVLEAGRLAPTAKNNQPQKIYVLESDEALAKINALCKSIRGAQTVLMVAVDTDNLFNNP
ncbi:MAG: nitroreductase family protein, partial [Erysipelotrichaceae bacterium]|nr:nitroreductase family protein [Erysipelotrichaceae bacterium]